MTAEFRKLTEEEVKTWAEGGARFERRDLGCDIFESRGITQEDIDYVKKAMSSTFNVQTEPKDPN